MGKIYPPVRRIFPWDMLNIHGTSTIQFAMLSTLHLSSPFITSPTTYCLRAKNRHKIEKNLEI